MHYNTSDRQSSQQSISFLIRAADDLRWWWEPRSVDCQTIRTALSAQIGWVDLAGSARARLAVSLHYPGPVNE